MESMHRPQARWSRRDFARLALASAGVLATGSAATSTGLAASGDGKGTVTRNPLYIPPTAPPPNLGLVAKSNSIDLGGGRVSTAWVYNGGFPGPTLLVRKGDTATIRLTNAFDKPVWPTSMLGYGPPVWR